MWAETRLSLNLRNFVNTLNRFTSTPDRLILRDVRVDENFSLDPDLIPVIYRIELEQLEAGMLLYDALYRWAGEATNEGHDCPVSSVKS